MEEKIRVMVAGLPGKMATLVAEHITRADDLRLVDEALSLGSETIFIKENVTPITLRPFDQHEATVRAKKPDVIVDFTTPDSVIRNAELYCRLGIPFIMGTTGGDREFLQKTVEESRNSAVIAPNMGGEIVAFQTAMEFMAKNFPGLFKGYKLVIEESHQQQKVDTSGTAKAMVKYFNELGIPFKEEEIIKIRNPIVQDLKLGVPPKYLSGHGWHTYTLSSEDGDVFFQFTHRVNGREIYARGTLQAIRFLMKYKKPGRVFSGIDVATSRV